MFKKVVYFLPTMVLISLYLIKPICSETKEQFVIRTIDGDTIELENGEKVRLIGIDAPEATELFYQEATLALREMVEGRKVKLERDPFWNKDKYGRFLRYVFLEEKLINCELVRLGLAKNIAERESKYYNCFQQAEQEAREKKIGIWLSS
ncbi:MAG: thermonuclease family protein [Candidatus Aenigmatarchaeota archaeon]